ncbi:Oidioi.mRNA.OKI2018_I69.chr2.g5950.t1.cds [Oikopleura dioica]|uniref:Oidioi.mRNA.OKI2018_I69.chr2.g5950.t1.cds n=1 Tax=Oikopleura dioica TaxID=34765 RepID=A0ABN7T7X4_OIKDI|nr:Oidioi.mRNA.OKI2018_I69.chr2.g5950.t1.cds [Oikopleura dioica]
MQEWIPLDNMPGYISGFLSVLSGAFGLSLLCTSTPASSASGIVASALAFSIIAMATSAAAFLVNINSILQLDNQGDTYLWKISVDEEVMNLFQEETRQKDIGFIMLAVSASVNITNFIIQLSTAFVICCSVPGFCCAPSATDVSMEKGEKNYALDEAGSVGNVDDLASFVSSGSIELPFYNGMYANGMPAIPDGQAPAPESYQDIPAPDYSNS